MDNAHEIARFVSFQSTLGRAPNTLKKYRARLRAFDKFLAKPWRNATRDDIAHALVAMKESGFKQNTLRDEKIVLKMFYSWLYELPKGEYPPCVSWVEAGKEEEKTVERDELITAEDLRRILAATPHARNKAVLATLWATGLRASELLGLRIRDFERVEGVWGLNVNGTKTAFSKRWVAITDGKILELLQAWIASSPQRDNPNAWLWLKEDGQRFSTRHLADIIKESHSRAGVLKPCNPHHYRHTWASFTARKGLPYETFVRMGGWALNSRVPQRYLHNDRRDDAHAVAASLTEESEREGQLIREVTRLVAAFIAKPDIHAKWEDFLTKREGAAAVRELAVKLAPSVGAHTKK